MLKDIFTDKEVMKTSTYFAGKIPSTEKEFNNLIYSILESNRKYQENYGLQKIFNKTLNEYVGVMGLIRCKGYLKQYSNDIVEGLIFLKSKYIGSGIGFWAEKQLFANLERLNNIMVASVWEENKPAIRLMKKNGMEFIGKTSKTYKETTIGVYIFIKFPSSVQVSSLKMEEVKKFMIVNKLSKANT